MPKSSLRDGERTPKVEFRFWTAYRNLAAAVKPASVESILSTCRHPFGRCGQSGKWKLGNARNTKQWYTVVAVAVLIGLLLIQTYWFILTTSSANLERHRDELDGIAGALRLLNVIMHPIDTSDFGSNAQIQGLLKNHVADLLENRPTLAALVATQDPMLQIMNMLTLDITNKSYRKQRVISMLYSQMAVLEKPWKIPWYLFMESTEDDETHKHELTNDDNIDAQLSSVAASASDHENIKASMDGGVLVAGRAQAMRALRTRLEDEQRQINKDYASQVARAHLITIKIDASNLKSILSSNALRIVRIVDLEKKQFFELCRRKFVM